MKTRHRRGRLAGLMRYTQRNALYLLSVLLALTVSAVHAQAKPRVIVATDGEIDDRCSMIRYLLYSNEFRTEGLIYTSSKFHWLGYTWSGVEWIQSQIEMYSRVYFSLQQNADGYQSPEELRSRIYVGNISNVGEMGSDSPGSDRIAQVLLDHRPGKVFLLAWGGTNTIARALWKIQHDHPDQVQRVSDKAILYIVLDQDDTFTKYIEPNWPKLQVLVSSRQFLAIAYPWAHLLPNAKQVFFQRPWMEGNITTNHGSLAGAYESLNGAFRSEGDSPSFMYEIPTGLRGTEDPSFGGWGGRFVRVRPGSNVWRDVSDDGDQFKPIWRWADAFQNDFAARAAWCVRPYGEANHPPVVNVQGATNLNVSPGDGVRLSVEGSSDPDGDRPFYSWWQYGAAGTYNGEVDIENPSAPQASVKIPTDAKIGDMIDIIAEVIDSGKPPLTRYARFVLTVTHRNDKE